MKLAVICDLWRQKSRLRRRSMMFKLAWIYLKTLKDHGLSTLVCANDHEDGSLCAPEKAYLLSGIC